MKKIIITCIFINIFFAACNMEYSAEDCIEDYCDGKYAKGTPEYDQCVSDCICDDQ